MGIDGFLTLFVVLALALVGASVPMILRLVKPNPWYGFRTPRTLGDESLWYAANAYSGRLLLFVGVLWLLAVVGLRFVPGIGTNVEVYTTVCGVLLVLGLLGVAGLSLWHLRSL